jgi:hypothetical protein
VKVYLSFGLLFPCLQFAHLPVQKKHGERPQMTRKRNIASGLKFVEKRVDVDNENEKKEKENAPVAHLLQKLEEQKPRSAAGIGYDRGSDYIPSYVHFIVEKHLYPSNSIYSSEYFTIPADGSSDHTVF